MTDQLLGLLRIVLLIGLYLFFARVLWAVWSEVRVPVLPQPIPPSTDDATAATVKVPRRQRVTELRVVAPKSLKGTRLELSSAPSLVGRVETAELSVPDDTYLSNRHARVWVRGGLAFVEDLQSTNGTLVNGSRISGVHALRAGDRVQMGQVLMEADR